MANYAYAVPVAGLPGTFVVRVNTDEWHKGYLAKDGSQGFPAHMSWSEASGVVEFFNLSNLDK